jgi:S1-C subfamily serine protease
MNASVKLLESVLPATVHLQVQVSPDHPSAMILGTDRAGSGTLIDPKGLVLTVHYVVIGADRIAATLLDGTKLPGEVAARDFATGLALVKLDTRLLPSVSLRPSTTLERGDEVFLVASANETARRVSNGAVTSVDGFDAYWEYSLDRAIITTAINPGLSGGAMFDPRGRMVGVVSLDLNEIGRFSLGIPVEYFLEHRDELLRHGHRVSRPPRAWIGVYCYSLRDRLVIAGVLPGTPGERAGLKPGDVLLAVDGHEVSVRRMLYRRLWTHRPGEPITCTVYRANEVKHLVIHAGDAEEFFA